MHWGLTIFERKRIERIALDHPFFDMHPQLLTRKELRAVLAQGPRKSGPQVIAEVRKELGMIYAPDCQNQRTFAEALRDVSFVPSFRRTVAVVALCLLMIFFMVFTVPGRAFAEEVYSIIINLVDGMLSAYNTIPSHNINSSDFASLPSDLETPHELAKYIDCPVFVSNDTLTFFEYDTDTPEVLSCLSQYKNSQELSYVISQEMYGPSISWGASVDTQSDSVEFETPSGIKLFLNQSHDGTFFAIGFYDSYTLNISCKDVSQEEFISILKRIYKAER